MLFAPADAVIVELMQAKRPNINYWHMATALGLEHWTVHSEGGYEDKLIAAVNPVLQVCAKRPSIGALSFSKSLQPS